jgi:hypothetical protein
VPYSLLTSLRDVCRGRQFFESKTKETKNAAAEINVATLNVN